MNQDKTIKDTNLIEKYINSLSKIEKTALEIASKELETSFDIEKSIGFLEFKKHHETN
jgi:hypothetical protein